MFSKSVEGVDYADSNRIALQATGRASGGCRNTSKGLPFVRGRAISRTAMPQMTAQS